MGAELSTLSSNKKRKRTCTDSFLLGISDFDEIIEQNSIFIDKTLFIKEWMVNIGAGVTSVILRSRRFGKSTNLSLLRSFFQLNAQPKSFSRFLISKDVEFMNEHCGKYPVVYINMKAIGGKNWTEMLQELWYYLRSIVLYDITGISKYDLKDLEIDTHIPSKVVAVGFLLRLTQFLHQKFNKKVIVLIDEYDSPLNHACRNGFYDEAYNFFQTFYSMGLKDNSALKRGCLMGIVELRGNGVLSELSNFVIHSSSTDLYSEYFGFNMEEIAALLDQQGLLLVNKQAIIQETSEWHNRYYMGSQQMINPWSFIIYFTSQIAKSY